MRQTSPPGLAIRRTGPKELSAFRCLRAPQLLGSPHSLPCSPPVVAASSRRSPTTTCRQVVCVPAHCRSEPGLRDRLRQLPARMHETARREPLRLLIPMIGHYAVFPADGCSRVQQELAELLAVKYAADSTAAWDGDVSVYSDGERHATLACEEGPGQVVLEYVDRGAYAAWYGRWAADVAEWRESGGAPQRPRAGRPAHAGQLPYARRRLRHRIRYTTSRCSERASRRPGRSCLSGVLARA